MVGNLTKRRWVVCLVLSLAVLLLSGCIHYEKRPAETTGTPSGTSAVTKQPTEGTEPPATEPPATTEDSSATASSATESFTTAPQTDANGFPNDAEDGATKRY